MEEGGREVKRAATQKKAQRDVMGGTPSWWNGSAHTVCDMGQKTKDTGQVHHLILHGQHLQDHQTKVA